MSSANHVDVSGSAMEKIEQLLARGFASSAPKVSSVSDINQGRGVFSDIYQLALDWRGQQARDEQASDSHLSADTSGGIATTRPATLVAKLPCEGPNRIAASTSGAYHRELSAYSQLLSNSGVKRPGFYAGLDFHDDTTGLLMEDLSHHRSVDQLKGFATPDALAVATTLARFHREWTPQRARASAVRPSIVSTLSESALAKGLSTLDTVWAEVVDPQLRFAFGSLITARGEIVELFSKTKTVTVCHGDPRADNLVFDNTDQPILFDWQQIAVQFGEADLAWMASTSLTIETRREIDRDIVASYAGDFGRYRLGFALPGLAVLMLAQRQLHSDREVNFVAESIRRIGQALIDLEVSRLSP